MQLTPEQSSSNRFGFPLGRLVFLFWSSCDLLATWSSPWLWSTPLEQTLVLVVTFLHGEKNSHKDAPAGKRTDAKSIAAQSISAI